MSDQGSPPPMSTQVLESLGEKIERKTTDYANIPSIESLVHRIPVEIRKLNKHAYIPSVVSIGPFHTSVEHLQIMEVDKLSYMQYLFSLFEDPIISEEKRKGCVDAMLEMAANAPNWYGELYRAATEGGRKVKFVEMMLLDGCFIIALLYRNYQRTNSEGSRGGQIADAILDNYSMKSAVQHDLIRLENQIPFLVLDTLFNLTVGTMGQFSLKEFIFSFYEGVMGLQRVRRTEHLLPLHILDYLLFLYRPSDNRIEVHNEGPSSDSFRIDTEQSTFRYSATQLDLAGVKFTRGSRTNLFDVRFHTNPFCFQLFCSGHLEIPPIPITSSTETFLRNLIAMEQFYEDRYHYFTSHAFLMDKLIDTAKDVDLLVEAGVIQNYLGSSEEVAHLYNNINKNVYTGGFHFTQPCKKVTVYCSRCWPKSLAKLKRDYFGNPWTIISVIAAFSIFVLTLLQTIYAMK